MRPGAPERNEMRDETSLRFVSTGPEIEPGTYWSLVLVFLNAKCIKNAFFFIYMFHMYILKVWFKLCNVAFPLANIRTLDVCMLFFLGKISVFEINRIETDAYFLLKCNKSWTLSRICLVHEIHEILLILELISFAYKFRTWYCYASSRPQTILAISYVNPNSACLYCKYSDVARSIAIGLSCRLSLLTKRFVWQECIAEPDNYMAISEFYMAGVNSESIQTVQHNTISV